MQNAPPSQSVQNGLQTPGNLLTQTANTDLGLLKETVESIAEAFFNSATLRQLADAHPLQLFRPKRPMMHASWAILGTAGPSIAHTFTPKAGTAARFMRKFPVTSTQRVTQAISCWEPPFQTKDKLPPLTTIQPETGKMVLFPSYLWHSTRPYSGKGRRQVVAFDYGKPNRFV